VRESIFNILQNRINLHGARVLDLFAGSGSLGFEALSRGASEVIFVDEWLGATKVIEENIELLQCGDRCDVIKADVFRFLRHADGRYELIFVDPPYLLERTPELPRMVLERGLLSRSGILIMEHATRTSINPGEGLQLMLERDFGATRVSFFAPPQPGSVEPPTTK
jgi:16S rRNA (guanine(966)-N(2))-methyltransferase RsmD